MSDLFDVSKETILSTGASQGLGRQFAGGSRHMAPGVVLVARHGGFLRT